MLPPDRATAVVSVTVRVPPAVAFAAFTEDIDAWWGRGPRYRHLPGGGGRLAFRPPPARALVEAGEDGDEHVIGEVSVWEPGERLVFAWRQRNFEPGQVTEVHVRFDAVEAGTRIVVAHHGWASLPADHPARHGHDDAAFAAWHGRWWAQLVSSLRERLAAAGEARA